MAEAKPSAPPPQIGEPGETCCGKDPGFEHNGGKPLGSRCILCKHASVYYRNEPGFQALQAQAANPGPGQYNRFGPE